MNKERIKKSVVAVGIGLSLGFVTDRVANGSISDHVVRREAPAAILPERIVLLAPEKRQKK